MWHPGAWWADPSGLPLTALGHRLECLQRIVSKLQMEAGLCEEQLNQADALLQSVRGRRVGLGQAGGAPDPPRPVASRPVGGELAPLAPPSWCTAS